MICSFNIFRIFFILNYSVAALTLFEQTAIDDLLFVVAPSIQSIASQIQLIIIHSEIMKQKKNRIGR